MLNATYEPLSMVSVRRAIVMILRERVDVVASKSEIWRSERFEISSPSVVRLRHFVRIPYSRRIPINRRTVFHRDLSACQYCGDCAENIDHVVPKSQGGVHIWENVVACCRRCNTKKGGRTPEQAGLTLSRSPSMPIRRSFLFFGAERRGDPAWIPYLSQR